MKEDFSLIYERFYDRIFKYAYTILLSREDAEDVVSETFLSAYSFYDSFDPDRASVTTWLTRIAHNKAVNLMRSAAYKKRADMPEEWVEPDLSEDFIVHTEASELVVRLYAHLTAEEREFLDLRYVMDMKDSDIAGLLGMEVKAVNKRYQRLLAKCRKYIS